MVASKATTQIRNGVAYRTCGKCGVEKLLTENFFSIRKDNNGSSTFRGVCKDCSNKIAAQRYQKKLSDPKTADRMRRRQRESSARQRKLKRVWIPKGTELASCISCCKNIASRSYIYGHELIGHGIFYIGKGSGRRAWDTINRSPNWRSFVGKNFDQGIIVHILADNLSDEEAYNLEQQKISELGLLRDGNGKLINLAEGGTGPSSDDMKQMWEKRLSVPGNLAKAQKSAMNNFNDTEVRARAISSREQNDGYRASREERLRHYSKNEEMKLKALETRSKNPNWRDNVKEGAKRRFEDANQLKKHQDLMQTEAWKTSHQQGVEKAFAKGTRMWFPDTWGHSGYFIDWKSRSEMCRAMGFNPGKVSDVINGNRSHHHKFHFENVLVSDD